MGWQVTSYIYGGHQSAPATQEDYRRVATSLDDAGGKLVAHGIAWRQAAMDLARDRASVPLCPVISGESAVPVASRSVAVTGCVASSPTTGAMASSLSSGSIGTASAMGTAGTTTHGTLPYERLIALCNENARNCDADGMQLRKMADLLVRAHSLYSEAEWKARRAFNETGQTVTKAFPGWTSLGMLGLILGGLGASWINEGKPKPSAASWVTAPFQEGYLSGIGSLISGTSFAKGLFSTDEVNQSAGKISKYSAPLKNVAQGNTLTVRRVRSTVDMVGPSTSVAESLENLRRLGEDKYKLGSGLQYATIAVQRYKREDGTNAWLVTIPGTDGHADSPFGWEQNIELMSDDPEQRKQADSSRMVVEAMRKAGIRSDEPVALIGHSQGGIVAAQIAADRADEYNISHVVTAGSPVANHPIPEKTWVTSIEMNDELVAALDGAQNPQTENWLTVRATVEPSAPQVVEDGVIIPRSNPYAAAQVPTASEGQELSHWLKYHQAAYQNASDLGSPAVEKHERHFAGVIDGKLRETLYYEGRMSY
ncbi:hypothetical protein G1C98_1619 [Bifidobacterium sp. DSM 109960]|uniref:GPI inositol-deacylase PGAP1-like alpha/beta domain-containing protein n=2 Tax=Bifidobacterium erythrocebi TaxID=2675325 RepID=A0A7Y0EVQ6_9BIFI|nr:hypothetical protein [Bifidobacterium sp. DSM 109960]